MKKVIVTLCLILGCANILLAEDVRLGVKSTSHGSTLPGGNKGPVLPWIIDLTNNVITMEATPCDYTLSLYDEDEAVVYSVFVPAGTTQLVLPTTLSGSFELRFETDTYYYYGFIYL